MSAGCLRQGAFRIRGRTSKTPGFGSRTWNKCASATPRIASSACWNPGSPSRKSDTACQTATAAVAGGQGLMSIRSVTSMPRSATRPSSRDAPDALFRLGIRSPPLLVQVGRKPVEVALGASLHLYQVLNDAQDVMAKDHRLPMGTLEVAINELGKIHYDAGQLLFQFAVICRGSRQHPPV